MRQANLLVMLIAGGLLALTGCVDDNSTGAQNEVDMRIGGGSSGAGGEGGASAMNGAGGAGGEAGTGGEAGAGGAAGSGGEAGGGMTEGCGPTRPCAPGEICHEEMCLPDCREPGASCPDGLPCDRRTGLCGGGNMGGGNMGRDGCNEDRPCPDGQVCSKNVLLQERSRRIIHANFRVTFQI